MIKPVNLRGLTRYNLPLKDGSILKVTEKSANGQSMLKLDRVVKSDISNSRVIMPETFVKGPFSYVSDRFVEFMALFKPLFAKK